MRQRSWSQLEYQRFRMLAIATVLVDVISALALFVILYRIAHVSLYASLAAMLLAVSPAPFLYSRLAATAKSKASKISSIEKLCSRIVRHGVLRVYSCRWQDAIICYNHIYDEIYIAVPEAEEAEFEYRGPIDFICARFERVKPEPLGRGKLYRGKALIAHPEKPEFILRVRGVVYAEELGCRRPEDAVMEAYSLLKT